MTPNAINYNNDVDISSSVDGIGIYRHLPLINNDDDDDSKRNGSPIEQFHLNNNDSGYQDFSMIDNNNEFHDESNTMITRKQQQSMKSEELVDECRKISLEIENEIDEFICQQQQHSKPSSSSSSVTIMAINYFQNMYPKCDDFEYIRPTDISSQIVSTFLLMYRSHCERLFDLFQLANVDEMRRSIQNFWHQMPTHLASFVSSSPFSYQVIKFIDTLLYRTMEDFFSQLSLLPEMSDIFIQDIRHIIENLEQWLYASIMDPSGQMFLIIFQHRHDIEMAAAATTTTTTTISQCRINEIQNEVQEHLVRFLNHKSRVFKDFSTGMLKQLEFIKMIKECRQTINQLRRQKCSKDYAEMISEIQSISIGVGTINCSQQQVLPMYDILATDPLDLIQMDEILKQDPTVVDSNDEMNMKIAPINNNFSNNNNNNNKRKKLWIDSFFCQCITAESANHSIEMIQKQFHLLIRYIQNVTDFSLIKILNWTKAIVDQNIWKCHWKCMRRRSKLLLYGINFYINNLMRDLTINESKTLSIWDMIFVCIKECLLLNLARIDRYEMKLSLMLANNINTSSSIICANGYNNNNNNNSNSCRNIDFQLQQQQQQQDYGQFHLKNEQNNTIKANDDDNNSIKLEPVTTPPITITNNSIPPNDSVKFCVTNYNQSLLSDDWSATAAVINDDQYPTNGKQADIELENSSSSSSSNESSSSISINNKQQQHQIDYMSTANGNIYACLS
nr:uncharacterized protein LOC124495386 [Dermatophagoides farinae]XP_046914706.1 uncharacterized protein LOC124495386 [Dermatophagoides farinae]